MLYTVFILVSKKILLLAVVEPVLSSLYLTFSPLCMKKKNLQVLEALVITHSSIGHIHEPTESSILFLIKDQYSCSP